MLLHHSASTPGLTELLARPNRKLLLYHNVTPALWLWDDAPVVAAHCALGREQLPELVTASDVAAADSAFNAAELAALGARRTEVIPLLIDVDRLGPAGCGSSRAGTRSDRAVRGAAVAAQAPGPRDRGLRALPARPGAGGAADAGRRAFDRRLCRVPARPGVSAGTGGGERRERAEHRRARRPIPRRRRLCLPV